jgi:hypothetical protein
VHGPILPSLRFGALPADWCGVGSTISFRHVGGALLILVAIAGIRLMPSHGAQPLRHDHTLEWSYVKVPHRPATAFERRLGDISSFVAGRSVQVRCEDFSIGTPVEPGGVVQFNGVIPAEYARIRPDVCSALVHFTRAPDTVSPTFAQALTVLAHESYHLHGVRNEALTQCYAMQAVPRVAHALGAPAPQARLLAVLEYELGYPKMPPTYQSADCRPNGPLDQHPGGGWPD